MTLALPRLWDLSVAWYDDRLSREYRSRTGAQVTEIFRRLGLEGEFWEVGAGELAAPQK